MQAQYSTQEQLARLAELYADSKPAHPAALIRLANINGLYDAADHVERMAGIDANVDFGAYDPAKLQQMMEW
jgi:hypothetical protein